MADEASKDPVEFISVCQNAAGKDVVAYCKSRFLGVFRSSLYRDTEHGALINVRFWSIYKFMQEALLVSALA